ncbi:MAG: glycosyltransferase family 4 protein [Sediminibacterium sp.]
MQPTVVLGIVSYKVFPALMGGQKGIADFYRHLATKTGVVLVVSKDNQANEPYIKNIYPLLYNHWKGLGNMRYLYELTRLVRQHKVTVIMIEHSYFGWLGVALRWLTQKPLVIRSHNIEAHRFRDMQRSLWWVYERYERWVHRQANHNFFVTEEDQKIAITQWQLDAVKCSTITHGTAIKESPSRAVNLLCREALLLQHHLGKETVLFLFNGTLDYAPNIDALRVIIHELLTRLDTGKFRFRIFICGSRISDQWKAALLNYPQLIFTGFVDDISAYYKGADCFINPITLGGGIRTKLVEALSWNQTVISTKNGARGIDTSVTGDKLILVDDYDWTAFARAMTSINTHAHPDTPAAFYRHYNWDKIVQKALVSLSAL